MPFTTRLPWCRIKGPRVRNRGRLACAGSQNRRRAARGYALALACPDDGQLHEAAVIGCVVDALRRLPVIPWFGPENIGYEGLRVAVVQGEPARLDLHHDPVTRQENVVCRGQAEAVRQRRIRGEGPGRVQALAVTAAK